MKFELVATEIFIEQIKKKIDLISSNPFRFKRIHSETVHNLFRVRLNIRSNEMRLIYAVLSPNIIPVCLLDRKDDYIDLEKYLRELQ